MILTYTGHEKDYETNLTYMLARYYSQGYGCFLSPDPGYDYDQLDPMSWNLYAYVRGNPVKHLDPTGKKVLAISINISAGVVVQKSYNWGIAIDDDGNVGFYKGKSDGFTIPATISIGVAISFSKDDVIQNLNSDSGQIGISGGVGLAGGVDRLNSDDGKFNGVSFQVGYSSKSMPPVEIHKLETKSKVSWEFNLKDSCSDIVSDAKYAVKSFVFSITEFSQLTSNENFSLLDNLEEERSQELQDRKERDEIRKKTGKKQYE